MTLPADRSRRKRVIVPIAVLGAVAAVGFGAAAATGQLSATSSSAAPSRSALPPATDVVARQTLKDTETKPGNLDHGEATTLTSRLGGTVTWLPQTGAVIDRGRPLYRLDDQPVVLMLGTVPTYRELSTGTEGKDVAQLEQNLKALGYSGFTVDDEFTSSTASAVKEWQEDQGLPETGRVELGRVVFLPGPIRVETRAATKGAEIQPGSAIITWTRPTRVVSVEVDAVDARIARKGAKVGVELPDGSTTPGTISGVETQVDDGGSGGGMPGGESTTKTKIVLTISLTDSKAVADLDAASVQVSFTVSERKDVLTVPVAALLALAEGGHGLQVVEGGTVKILAVKTGFFADGRVEVTGDGLREGMTVGMPA